MKVKKLFNNLLEKVKNLPKKYLIIIGAALLVFMLIIILLVIFRNEKISKSNIDGYSTYSSKRLNITFDFPNYYKIKKEKNIIYISKSSKGSNYVIPYFIIEVLNTYESSSEYFDTVLENGKDEYGYTFTPITEKLSTMVGEKFTEKILYNYVIEDTLVLETRHVFKYNDILYRVSSLEDRTSSKEINEIINNIISSLETLEK